MGWRKEKMGNADFNVSSYPVSQRKAKIQAQCEPWAPKQSVCPHWRLWKKKRNQGMFCSVTNVSWQLWVSMKVPGKLLFPNQVNKRCNFMVSNQGPRALWTAKKCQTDQLQSAIWTWLRSSHNAFDMKHTHTHTHLHVCFFCGQRSRISKAQQT